MKTRESKPSSHRAEDREQGSKRRRPKRKKFRARARQLLRLDPECFDDDDSLCYG